jgi:hypothetical protein
MKIIKYMQSASEGMNGQEKAVVNVECRVAQ